MNLIVFSYSGTVSRVMRLMVFFMMGLTVSVLADTVVDFQDQVNNPGNGTLPPTNDTYTYPDEIYPVQMGMPVTFSSQCSNNDCSIFRLDASGYAWAAGINNIYQWVQISSLKPRQWKGVITQGKSNADEWVEEYQVAYTSNGGEWELVDEGRLFAANNDRYSKVRNNFNETIFARAIRVHPTKWRNNISMRF